MAGSKPWQGTDRNEAVVNSVNNALVAVILDGVKGVSPPHPGHEWRQISPEEADAIIARGKKALADLEGQAPAPGGAKGRAQKWMAYEIDKLRRQVSDAEAVRAGKRPQKMKPEDYEALRKSLGVGETRSSKVAEGTWGIWDVTRKQWLPDAMRGAVDSSPARYKSKADAERAAQEWRTLNPNDQFEVKLHGVSEAHETGHRVADFNTLDDLIQHELTQNQASHVDRTKPRGPRIFYPIADGYEVSSVWQKGGYWHAQAPGARGLTQNLPRGAQPIEGDAYSFRGWPRHVRDYEAIDRQDRVIAGPFKSYGDAKDAAGSAGAVRFVPKGKRAKEMRATRKTAAQIAKILFIDDMGRRDDVPVETDGRKAYDAWLTAAGSAGDEQTVMDLEAVSRREFAAAWNALVEEHGLLKATEAPRAVTAHRDPADQQAATELVMYIENESDLSPDGPRGQGQSVRVNALKKWRAGTYDPVLGVRLFEYLAEAGAKRYAKEFSVGTDWSTIFNPATRHEAARQLEASFRSSAENGEYDRVGKTTEAPRVREDDAEAAGAAYAQEQLESDHFMDWVREQLVEASKMPASDVLPLEDKHDAKIISRNMLQQLEWDTRREHDGNAEFYKGFRETLDMNREWLAEELLTMNQEIHGGGVVEARRPGPSGPQQRTKFKIIQLDDGYFRVVMTKGGQSFISKKKHSVRRGAFWEQKELNRHILSWEINPAIGFEPFVEGSTGTKESSRPKAQRSVRRRR